MLSLFKNDTFDWERDAVYSLESNINLVKICCLIYCPLIFGIKNLNLKLKLNKLFFLWNISLSIFSFIGTLILVPNLIDIIYNNSFNYSICYESYKNYPMVSRFAYYFIISKIFELIDTIFIALKSSNIIFLHWWHHLITLIYCWESGILSRPSGLWFCTMNYTVHSFMYLYYALSTLNIKIKNKWIITILQISQMIIGCYVTFYYSFNCSNTEIDYFGLTMYFIYLFLFINHLLFKILKIKIN